LRRAKRHGSEGGCPTKKKKRVVFSGGQWDKGKNKRTSAKYPKRGGGKKARSFPRSKTKVTKTVRQKKEENAAVKVPGGGRDWPKIIRKGGKGRSKKGHARRKGLRQSR